MGKGATETGRILWLGDRPNSIGDEPGRLRRMGFPVTEVAEDIWGCYVKGGAPADVAAELRKLNSGRPQISRECGDLLNRSFETIVVANSAIWANELLRVYDRRLIVRAHGWDAPLGAEIFHLGSWPIRLRRGNIHHVVAHDYIAENDPPFGAVATAPAWLDETLHRFKDTWRGTLSREPASLVIGVPHDECRPASKSERSFIERHFSGTGYSQLPLFGRRDVDDWKSQRDRFQALQAAAGYLDASFDTHQLHILPLEMMLVGGPVVYFAASPLNRLMPPGAPGCAQTIDDAHEICDRLRRGDQTLISDILASQEALRASYHVDVAGPAFETLFSEILNAPETNRPGVARTGLAYESDLTARQIRQLLGALTYDAAAADGHEPRWSADDVVRVFYRILLSVDPDPQAAAAHVEALRLGAPPMQILKTILKQSRLPANERRAKFLWSFGLAQAQVHSSKPPSVRLGPSA